MKSLLFSNSSPFIQPTECQPCRVEKTITVRKNGRLYRFVVRDKIVVEDPMLVMVKAEAFAIFQAEPFAALPTPRSVKDFLIKSSLVV